jgi:ribosomal protein S18 acetylase RimI-like enzyme
LLILNASQQRKGFGTEAARAIEDRLAADGWNSIRLNVLGQNVTARRFWQALGYEIIAETEDTAGRAVFQMEKPILEGRGT